jgi:hypothetical protein
MLALSQSQTIPRQVIVALCLLAAGFSTAILRVIFAPAAGFLSSGSHAVVVVVLGGLYFAWVYGLFRRLNWLRWVTIVVSCFGMVTIPWYVAQVTNHTLLVFHLLHMTLQVPAMVLLCLRSARVWYGQPTVT